MRDPAEGARPEELPRPHLLLPAEGQPRLHATLPAAVASDVRGGGVRVHSVLDLGAISPSLEQSGALRHGGAEGRVRHTARRAPRGQICAQHHLQQSALDHESLERSGAAAVADSSVSALRFRHNAATDHPECQRRARPADGERPLQLRPSAVHRTASGTIHSMMTPDWNSIALNEVGNCASFGKSSFIWKDQSL